MAEDIRNEDTPHLFAFVTLRPRKQTHYDSGYPMILVEGMPMGCNDPKSMVVISREADVVDLQVRGIPFPGYAAVTGARDNVEDSVSVHDFRTDIWHGRVRMYFRYHYLLASGYSTVTLDRSNVKKAD